MVYICPLCGKVLALEDFRSASLHSFVDVVVFEERRTVFDKAAGEATVTEKYVFCRSCIDSVVSSIREKLRSLGLDLVCDVAVVEADRPRLVLSADIDRVAPILRSAVSAVLEKLTWRCEEEKLDYKPLYSLPSSIRARIEHALRQLGMTSDSVLVRVLPPSDRVTVYAHMIVLTSAGVVKLLVPVEKKTAPAKPAFAYGRPRTAFQTLARS